MFPPMDASKKQSGASRKIILSKWRWTHEEDQLLINLVAKHGPRNWKVIAHHIQGRSGKSCRFRWVTQLNPKVDRSLFSEDELERLINLQRSHGNKWSNISCFFPGRTDNQLKNKYHVLAGTRNKKVWSPSSRNNHCGTLNGGSVNFSRHGCVSTTATGSQFSFFPPSTTMNDGIAMPVFSDGSFSVDGRDKNLFAASLFNPRTFESVNNGSISVNQRTVRADSIISDARTSALSEMHPLAQPRKRDGSIESKYGQFIDFLGVGN